LEEAFDREAREEAFIELSSLRDDVALGDRVVEEPGVVVWWIAKEDALLHVRFEFLALVLLHKDVGNAAKDPEAAEIRLLAIPGLEGRLARKGTGRHAVPDLHLRCKAASPQAGRQVGLREHRSDVVQHDLVRILCISVLLGAIPHSVEAHNPRVVTEGVELCGHVLSSLVIVQRFDSPPSLVLHMRLVQLEGCKGVALLLEQHHDPVACSITDEHDPVAVSLWSGCSQRATQVGVNEVKGMRRAVASGREGGGLHLACKARLADRIARRRGRDGDASTQPSDELGDVRCVPVTKTLVPELQVEWASCDRTGRLRSR